MFSNSCADGTCWQSTSPANSVSGMVREREAWGADVQGELHPAVGAKMTQETEGVDELRCA